MKLTVLFGSALALTCISATALTYTGIDLQGLTYTGNPASDAKFVNGSPPYAELYTANANLGDIPEVSATGPFGTLGSFSASYVLRSQIGGGTGNSGYWAVWINDPANPLNKIQIIAYSGGSMNGGTQVHGDASNPAGITFGALLSNVDLISYGSTTLGNWIVDSAGVEIGNYRNYDGPMDITISSITLPGDPVPELAATWTLLAIGLGALAGLRRRA